MGNKKRKKIPDAIDLTQLDKNTFGFMTHDEFFTIREISYIANIDIKTLEEVILKLNLKIDNLYSKKEIFKIIDYLSEKKVLVNKNQQEEKIKEKNPYRVRAYVGNISPNLIGPVKLVIESFFGNIIARLDIKSLNLPEQ